MVIRMDEMLRDLRMLALASNTLRLLAVVKKIVIGLMVALTALRAVRIFLRLRQSNGELQVGVRAGLHS